MKRLLVSLILALSLAIPSAAQVVEDPSTGGGASSGSSVGGCSAITAILNVVSGTLACNPASVVNGSVSTAGRSILTIRDTITGASATSNFLNITGMFPASTTVETVGLKLALSTSASDSPTIRRAGLRIDLSPETVGSGKGLNGGTGIYSLNSSQSTDGTNSLGRATLGGQFIAAGSSTVINGGLRGEVIGPATVLSYGIAGAVIDSSGASPIGIGVIGDGGTSNTVSHGGFFRLVPTNSLTAPTSSSSAALVADNTSVAANIFEARDNGTAVFTIADGGAVTSTANIGITIGAGSFLPGNNGNTLGGLGANSVFTPDAPFYFTGSLSNSLHLLEAGDVGGFDFQNPCTTGLGTAACTDPTLIVHSHNQDTGEFLSMAHDGKAGVIAGGNSTVLDGLIRLGGTVTLTESSATTVLTIPIPVSTGSGGFINYVVDARDATNVQVRTGNVSFAVANNSGGTETCNVFGVGPTTQAAGGDTTNPANPTQVQDGSGVGAITSGTLTYAWSVDTTGSNSCVLKLNAVSSLTQTTLQVHYTVISTGPAIVTGG